MAAISALALALVPAAGPSALAQNDTLYKYDAAGRLIEVTYDGKTVRYSYDALGNRRIVRAASSFSNTAPDAINDAVTVVAGKSVNFYPVINDKDDDGEALTITSLGSATYGTASRVGNRVSYSPTAPFQASDSFTYTVSDGTTTDTATVNVTITLPAIFEQVGVYSASSYQCGSGGGEYADGQSNYMEFCFDGSGEWHTDTEFYTIEGPLTYCLDPFYLGEEWVCGDNWADDYVPVGNTIWTQAQSSNWVSVDLGSLHMVQRVEIMHANATDEAEVEYHNGSTWVSAGTVDGCTCDPLNNSGTWDTVYLDGRSVRYIRVIVPTYELLVTGFRVFAYEQ